MKWVKMFIIVVILSLVITKLSGQYRYEHKDSTGVLIWDSISLKVTYSKTITFLFNARDTVNKKDTIISRDSTYYVFKILETGEKVRSVCCCKPKPKGTIVRRAVKDMEFIKPE